jgi:ribonuclease HII
MMRRINAPERLTVSECEARKRGYPRIAGVDEAGRGPLAGPVVAAAVIFPEGYSHREINDSKQLSAKKRERLYDTIKADALAVGLGVVEAQLIDEVNILQASLLAMKEAVSDLELTPDYLLIDGNRGLAVDLPQESVVRGDGLSVTIAAASIVAKVSRDRIMEIYHRQFPQYNFQKNKGYGTKEHIRAIRRFGLCKIHRKTFHLRKDLPDSYPLFADSGP